MYTKEIILLITWPVSIYITYLLVRYFLKIFDKTIHE